MHKFLQFIEGHYIVAHCADFDLNFINIQLKRYVRSRIFNPAIDTMTLAYHLHPTQKQHHLDHLLEQYRIPIRDRHHALEDARMTAQLFIKLMDQLERRGITTIRGLDNYIKSMHILHNHPSL
ncbi:PolC-type DNA polymerase III [Ammoniphilus sp. 3BR4]|uniref:3'-5' exonuclease n=1 Tax=Ammoniphilus sp. 3BR4 TaxID=3158265 RepID=UPI003466A29C